MSMGVLNNIAATYAANNLSNTQASLQNVLTQLSSGSRINSGADDAAGLSLANGLQANQSALTQSASNVSLGVGLLQTADGALSQVNNLLNRAVTLATEAGNGTLNTSQSGAADQEYQSILAEINSIGATTTYNGQAVFGAGATPASFSIYTSDGSATGTSTDTLSIAALSSSSVGDSGGTIGPAAAGNGISYTVGTGTNLSATKLTGATTAAVTTAAQAALTAITAAISGVAAQRFGSPTSGQGIDVASTVTQMVTQLKATETPYKNQLTALQSQDTVISNLGSLLSTLSNDITALTDPAGVLSGKQGSSSDTNTLALLSANTTATAGSHTVTVQQLAQTSTEASSAVGANDMLSGSFTFHIGSGGSQTVSVDPANATIAGLAATINQGGLGVTGSVVTDSSGSRLSLISQTSGAAGQISIDSSALSDTTTGNTVSLIAGQSGQDAIFTVDGIQTTSATNTITGAISGVTMQLLGKSSTPVQVEIDNEPASITSALSTMVNDYNAVVSALSAQEGKDASGNPEPLYGSPIISQLQQMLSGAFTTPSGTSLTSPTQVGLSLNSNGTLALNTDQLTSALNDNFSGVQAFFQNTTSFGLNLEQAVNNAGTGSTKSILTQAQNANSTAETSLNSTISTMDARIATQQTNLTSELNAANQTLQAIPMQLNMVNEIYSAITGFNQNQNG